MTDQTPAALPPEQLAQVRALVEVIPMAEDDSGAGIVGRLLAATDLDSINAPWESTSGRDLAGRTLVIRDVRRRPSRFEDSHGLFLVADCADAKTGEAVTLTTSAIGVVMQLAQCWRLGMLPVTAEVVVAARPTEQGFLPYHLRLVAAAGAGS